MNQEPEHGVVAGIVVAAGAALRMGQTKQLLDIGGSPMLQHVIDVAEASTLDEVVVVLGSHAAQIEARISGQRSHLTVNPDYRRGNVSSLVCGAAAVPRAEAFVLLMGDQPEIRVSAVDRMTSLWRRDRPWGAVTRYRDRIGHPYLLSRDCFDAAARMGGSKVLWEMLAQDASGRVAHAEDDRMAPADINTPDDYRELMLRRQRQLPR